MDSLTELFCLMEDFCRRVEPAVGQRRLTTGVQKRRRRTALSLSELMTLIVLFHPLRFRPFKRFYLDSVYRYLRAVFATLPSDPRWVGTMAPVRRALGRLVGDA